MTTIRPNPERKVRTELVRLIARGCVLAAVGVVVATALAIGTWLFALMFIGIREASRDPVAAAVMLSAEFLAGLVVSVIWVDETADPADTDIVSFACGVAVGGGAWLLQLLLFTIQGPVWLAHGCSVAMVMAPFVVYYARVQLQNYVAA